jgi:hypothetical protein
MESIGDHSTSMALSRTMHDEARRARGSQQRDPTIAQALQAQLQSERDADAQSRAAAADAAKLAAETALQKRKSASAEKALQAVRKKLSDAISMQQCADAIKNFSPEVLGNGKSRGGPLECRKSRLEVMERLASRGAEMSAQEKNDWQWFKTEWDTKMASEYDRDWGMQFAQWMQELADKLADGSVAAIVEFMYNETKRVLATVLVLRVP